MAAWLGASALREDFAEAPCGCAFLTEVAKLEDEGARQLGQVRGAELQQLWRCRHAGYTPVRKASDLHPRCRRVIQAVSIRTGLRGCAECPRARVRDADVQEGMRAFRYFEKGALSVLYDDPPCIVIDAIDVIADGVSTRERYEREEAARKTKQQIEGKS